ncbi:MAG: bifunctional riboflavin kinase/FAD synthetase [Deltaproteobacteria bacterium]|nr:bifunctional riboflavin kinase/FAD synthetase [Deltaproteobacteria bacterium]MBW2346073.1 bifunctional riboflavin kinase/FAD synthetase [Deltaproteobacteria bacterium]
MTIFYDLNQLEKPLKNPVLTIGNFDGVHKGHMALFERVKEKARSIHGQSSVMTFDPHPIKVMKPGNGPSLITPTEQKLELIDAAGIDIIFCIPFTRQFAAISARDFVQNILVEKIGIKELVVGYDYTFGHNREGNIELLKEMGSLSGFAVDVLEQVSVDNTLISSTSIRHLVDQGNLSEARRLLGRDYQICGTVIKGKNRGGRLLGFPTANLQLVDELTPKVGVYAVEVLIDDQVYFGLTNIGYNPTFENNQFSVETHILDFSKDLLGETIRVNFIERLRDEKTFTSIEDLSEQIGKDVLRARKLFNKLKEQRKGPAI